MFGFITNLTHFLLGSRRRALLTIIFLILISLLIWWQFGQTKQAPQYQTAQVSKGPLVVSVSESGNVAVANRVSISTQTSGTINQVYVKNGDNVTAGEKIADLVLDTDGLSRQAQAYTSLLSAQNNLNTAKSKMNSLQSALFKANQAFVKDKGVGNPSDADKADPKFIEENADWLQAESDYNNQAGVIAQAEAGISAANLSYNAVSSTIIAPVDGVISDITIAPGLVVSTSQSSTNNNITSQVVASIKHSGTPIISVSLPEIDAAKVQAGQHATITFDALPNKTFTGKVLGIDTTGTVSSGVTSYPATIALDSANDSILPNMSATANIIINIKDNVLLIPTAAVKTQGQESTVNVLKNGKVQSVSVTIGDSSDTDTEIVSGLSEGDTVVTSVVTSSPGTSTTGASPFGRVGGFGGGFGGGARGGGRGG